MPFWIGPSLWLFARTSLPSRAAKPAAQCWRTRYTCIIQRQIREETCDLTPAACEPAASAVHARSGVAGGLRTCRRGEWYPLYALHCRPEERRDTANTRDCL